MRLPIEMPAVRPLRASAGLAALLAVVLLGGCAQVGVPSLDLLSSADSPKHEEMETADGSAGSGPQSELQKATEYWGKQYAKNPRDAEAALSYAKNLKALGQKQQALMVLQQASLFHGGDRRIASEYGRLALDLDQVGVAAQLLEAADDPSKPDWRVVAARGTVLAKQGRYSDAIPFYQRALTLAPGQPSVLNNLALAHTMSGNAAKGEELLRQAAGTQGASPKVRENLALVLGVSGKYEESKQVASSVMPVATASADIDLLRRMTNKPGVAAPAQDAPVNLATTEPGKAAARVVKTAASARASAQRANWSAVVADGDSGNDAGPMLRATKD